SQTLQAERQSFFSFLSPDAVLWFKDVQLTGDVIQKSFDAADESFHHIAGGGKTQVVSGPEVLFDDRDVFQRAIESFPCVEFGSRFFLSASQSFQFASGAQPSFNKNFRLLTADLERLQNDGYRTFIASDLPHQLDKIQSMFAEISATLKVEPLEFSLRAGFQDADLKIACYTDHQIFERFHRYKAREKFSKSKALTLREPQTLQPGDFVTHIDYGIAEFAGLEKKLVNGHEQDAIRRVHRDAERRYVSMPTPHKLSMSSGTERAPPVINKLGTQERENKKAKARKRVRDIAKELIELYAKRKTAPGFAYPPDGFLQAELESSFLYEDTPDQAKATEDV